MGLSKELFGTTSGGAQVYKYTLTNENGMTVSLIEYGAAIQSILVPDRAGALRDVTVGFDDMDGFENRTDYQGVIAGPYANRIGGSICIDGTVYDLEKNEDGVKTLHGCGEYTHTIWQSEPIGENGVKFTYTRQDGLHGYPGAIRAEITYTLRGDNALAIAYNCVSDKKTYINPTNHTYFNLGGFDSGDILSHELTIYASEFTPVDKFSLPTGGNSSVDGTPFDFRAAKPIGKEIDCACEQLQNTGGYDHNFCIDGYDGTMKTAAKAYCEKTGISMTVLTNLPGVQFYAGNFLKGVIGKQGVPMNLRSGFCLETQFYPDTPNHPEFPSCLFDAGETYRSETVFAFQLN